MGLPEMKAKVFLILPLVLVLFSCIKTKAADKVLEKNIERIVCLSPSGAEILCELGAKNKIVARTDFCDYPSDLQKIYSVGGFDGKSISLENIVQCKPDFVYCAKGMHEAITQGLEKLGVECYLAESSDLDSIKEEIIFIGKKLALTEQADFLCRKIDFEIAKVSDKIKNEVSVSEQNLSVYYEVWNSPLMTCGKKSYINSLLDICGLQNIFNTLDEAYPIISEESIIINNPQVILVPKENGVTGSDFQKRNGWKEIRAVKNNRIYLLDSDIVSGPGPRIIDAVKHIAGLVYTQINFYE